jgi:oxygen-independent coproporphyrinogen-3 oxidase
MEVNPGVTESYLSFLRNLGVNRIIIGVQSLNEETLTFLGRRNLPGEALKTLEKAQKEGFDNLGIDLIYSCPTEKPAAFLTSLKILADMPVRHISCYQLTLKEPTPLALRHARGDFVLPDEEEEWRYFRDISLFLQDLGFTHYEVSNYARPDDHRSCHNSKYWRHVPYLGLGPSAHSFLGNRRWWNPSSLEEYFKLIATGDRRNLPGETLSPEELAWESLFLGLRTKDGVDWQDWQKRYGQKLPCREQITAAAGAGLLELSGSRARPTLKGMALADRLALMLAGS